MRELVSLEEDKIQWHLNPEGRIWEKKNIGKPTGEASVRKNLLWKTHSQVQH